MCYLININDFILFFLNLFDCFTKPIHKSSKIRTKNRIEISYLFLISSLSQCKKNVRLVLKYCLNIFMRYTHTSSNLAWIHFAKAVEMSRERVSFATISVIGFYSIYSFLLGGCLAGRFLGRALCCRLSSGFNSRLSS